MGRPNSISLKKSKDLTFLALDLDLAVVFSMHYIVLNGLELR